MSVNKVIIVGRLGQDPELKYTPSGAGVCKFSVATSESWVDKGGQKQEKTEWHRIVVWNKLAELCNQYLSKGRQVYLEGRLQTSSWEGKDGQKRYMTDINALTVQFLGGPSQAAPSSRNDGPPDIEPPSTGPNNGDSFVNKNFEVKTDANFTADDIPF